MTGDLTQAAMGMWATKDLPARLLSAQVAKILNCTTEDIALLVSAGKLKPLGKPKPNAVKFFSAIELLALLADRDWLDVATRTISLHWRRKHAKRTGSLIQTGEETKNARRNGGQSSDLTASDTVPTQLDT